MTRWWNRSTKILFGVIAALAFITIAVVAVIKIFRPVEFAQICTLVACSGGINVEIGDLPANTPYQVNLTFPSGETQTIVCDFSEENSPNPFEKSCSSNGAFFSLKSDVTPPETITVTIVVGENQVLQDFQPAYEKTQPNGPNCPPVCYSATLKINLSQ